MIPSSDQPHLGDGRRNTTDSAPSIHDMPSRSEPGPEQPEQPQTLRFHYMKQPDFRALHVTGIVGGISPKGGIQGAFFTERFPIPQQAAHRISGSGVGVQLGEEVLDQRIQKDGVIRDVHFGIIIDKQTALSLIDWLQHRIADLETFDAAEVGAK